VDTPDRRSIALVVGGILAIVGTVVSFVPVTIWGLAVMGMSILATAWTKSAWKAVEVEAKFEPERAFVGETVRIKVRVRNGKRLPLPFVRIGVWLPRQLEPVGETGSAQIHGFRRRTTLGGHAHVQMEFEAIAKRRGEYHLRVIEVDLSDPFALAPLHREFNVDPDVLVMPEPRIPIPVPVRRRLPFGTPSPAMRMFEQPERFAGVRPYQPGDPLNRIHWKLTGHAGDLQVKLYEPTRAADVLLAMDLSLGEPFWHGIYPDIAEETIGWTSFLARLAVAAGWRVGIIANTHLSKGRGAIRVLPSAARAHEPAVFAALARMPNEPSSDLAPVLRDVGRRMGRTGSVVVVSPRPGSWLVHEMENIRRRGAEVLHVSPLEVDPKYVPSLRLERPRGVPA
jgi:uncharacterized protein (DUF58 family)